MMGFTFPSIKCVESATTLSSFYTCVHMCVRCLCNICCGILNKFHVSACMFVTLRYSWSQLVWYMMLDYNQCVHIARPYTINTSNAHFENMSMTWYMWHTWLDASRYAPSWHAALQSECRHETTELHMMYTSVCHKRETHMMIHIMYIKSTKYICVLTLENIMCVS